MQECLPVIVVCVSLPCVFHSIRFKVNKIGVRRYPIFFCLFAPENPEITTCDMAQKRRDIMAFTLHDISLFEQDT